MQNLNDDKTKAIMADIDRELTKSLMVSSNLINGTSSNTITSANPSTSLAEIQAMIKAMPELIGNMGLNKIIAQDFGIPFPPLNETGNYATARRAATFLMDCDDYEFDLCTREVTQMSRMFEDKDFTLHIIYDEVEDTFRFTLTDKVGRKTDKITIEAEKIASTGGGSDEILYLLLERAGFEI